MSALRTTFVCLSIAALTVAAGCDRRAPTDGPTPSTTPGSTTPGSTSGTTPVPETSPAMPPASAASQ